MEEGNQLAVGLTVTDGSMGTKCDCDLADVHKLDLDKSASYYFDFEASQQQTATAESSAKDPA